MNPKFRFAAVLLAFVGSFSPVLAQRAEERTATRQRQAQTDSQARQVVRNLFERLCPGRCELIQTRVVMQDAEPVALLEPGFEDDAPAAYEGQVESLRVDVLIDSALPASFRRSLPRMLRYQLSELAPTVEVRTEALQFPEPQAAPAPPVVVDPPRPLPRIAPPPPVEPQIAELEPTPAEPAEADPVLDWRWLVAALAGLLLLGLMALLLWRRKREASPPTQASADLKSTSDRSHGEEQVRWYLANRRSLVNRALRRWLDDDETQVAHFVKIFGADCIRDLRDSREHRAGLARVAEMLLQRPGVLSVPERQATIEHALARLSGAELLEASAPAWDFLEGLSAPQLGRLLSDLPGSECASLLTELPESVRQSYLTGLSGADRTRLALEATRASTLSSDQREQLRHRLRAAAEELRPQRANDSLVTMLLRGASAEEQLEIVGRLQKQEPELLDQVLEEELLEIAVAHLPDAVVADVAIQSAVETLTTFAGGLDSRYCQLLLEALPERTRQVVQSELALGDVVSRERFVAARQAFLSDAVAVLRREGGGVLAANRAARAGRAAMELHEAAE